MKSTKTINKNTSGIERELYRFLRKHSCVVQYFKQLTQSFSPLNQYSWPYNCEKTVHMNLRRKYPYDYHSPKDIILSVLKPWKNQSTYEASKFFSDISDKWYYHYKKNKLCAKYCTRKGVYIEENFTE